MAKKAVSVRKPSQADILRLGADVAQQKAQTNPKAWASFVKAAHARGETVAGALSGAPPALREHTQSYLTQQASKNISTAYAPAISDLDSQQRRAQAYADKRSQDMERYNQWLSDQTGKLAAQYSATQSQLAAANAQIAASMAGVAGAAPGQAQAAASAQGRVTNPAQSNQLTQGVASAAQGAAAQTQAGVDRAQNTLQAGNQQAAALGQAAVGQQQALAVQSQNDSQALFKDIIDKRSALNVQKAKDYVNEFTRLQTQEVQNADANRNYDAAAQQLGIASAKVNLQSKTEAHNYAINKAKVGTSRKQASVAQQNANTNRARAQEQARHNKTAEQIAAENAATRKILATKPKPSSSASTKPLTMAQKVSQRKRLSAIQGLSQNFKANKKNKGDKTPAGRSEREVLRAQGATDLEIDAALHPSTPAGKKALKALGLG